ncbi:MAG TPA: hypothetical protein VFT32_06295, partial [Candidatus Eisenbacteria bacterium]|nr:hypothetical protein [Candidatus Eisenbacteria bacterium]
MRPLARRPSRRSHRFATLDLTRRHHLRGSRAAVLVSLSLSAILTGNPASAAYDPLYRASQLYEAGYNAG